METQKTTPNQILSFLQGGKGANVEEFAQQSPELLARCMTYMLKGKYHRRNMCHALLALLNQAPKDYRGVGWALFQRIPFSHLLELLNVVTKKTYRSRVRLALASKIAQSSYSDLVRAYFISPEKYRQLFHRFYLPRDRMNGNSITNEIYKFARLLASTSLPNALKQSNLTKIDLLKRFHLPVDKVMPFIETPQEALDLAYETGPKTFLEHGRWFRNIIGDAAYHEIAVKRIEALKDPFNFLGNKDHLLESGVLTPTLLQFLEGCADHVMQTIMTDFNLQRLALLVDASGSMKSAIQITNQLYEAFSRMETTVTDIIGFKATAFTLTFEGLRRLTDSGTTAIGKAIELLNQNILKRNSENIPQAILLVSDLGENEPPTLNKALRLMQFYDNPPLIVIHCGDRTSTIIEYPHAIIEIDTFHKGLLKDIVRRIAQLTAKVAVTEKEVTKIVKQRRPIEEEIGTITLPERPSETLKRGYLERLLCPPTRTEAHDLSF
jgi:hypothetical protein